MLLKLYLLIIFFGRLIRLATIQSHLLSKFLLRATDRRMALIVCRKELELISLIRFGKHRVVVVNVVDVDC